MKVLQINNHFERRGGSEAVFHDTIDLLKKNGHEVVTLSRIHSQKQEYDSNYFLTYTESYYKRLNSKKAVFKIFNILEKEKPDLVHVHNLIGGITFSVLPIIKKKNIPILMTVHDFRMICPAGLLLNGKNELCQKCMGKNYYHCIINKCSRYGGFTKNLAITIESYLRDKMFPVQELIDCFIFVSNKEKEKFLEIKPELKNKSITIHNFVKKIEPSTKQGTYYFSFGRLTPEKGIFTLLKAFAECPDLKLKIAGDGFLYDEILRTKTNNIELVGFKSGKDLEELILNASFIIVPSEWFETLSLTTAESLSLGKPVIVSKIGALSELIINDYNGYFFESQNIDQLKKVLMNSSNISSEKYKQLSENAYLSAKDKFSEEIYFQKLMSIYKSFYEKHKNI